jgi:hypothetical protein
MIRLIDPLLVEVVIIDVGRSKSAPLHRLPLAYLNPLLPLASLPTALPDKGFPVQ